MIATGPYTLKNSLSYQGLLDFLSIVKREQPHLVIFMGPFLDFNNLDIYSGDIFFEKDGKKVYVTYEDLFADLINTISKELRGLHT
jgi:hypothetical protein